MKSRHVHRAGAAGLTIVLGAALAALTGLPAIAAGTPVVVTATDQGITYGQPDPTFGFTFTGFATGDGFSTAPTCGVSGAHANAGTYPITCSGGVSTATTTSTTSHSITVQTANAPATGISDPTVQGHIGNAAGDTGTSGWGPAKSVPFAPNPYAAEPGTNYVDLFGTVLNEASLETFRVAFDLPAGATNVALNGRGFADDTAAVYIGTTQIGQITGFYAGDDDPFSSTTQSLFATGRNYLYFVQSNTGGPGATDFLATITYDTVTTQPKYAISYQAGTLTVAKAPVVVTADNKTMVYGTADPAFTSSASGLLGSDSLTTAATCGVTGAHQNVGTYPITCSGAAAGGNYNISYQAGTLTVTKAPLTVTTSSTSTLVSLLTFRVGYTTVVKNAVTGAPVSGVPVTTRIDGASPSTGCTAVTNASGVATCVAGPIQISILTPFKATVPETANYLAGSDAGFTPLL